MTVPTTGTAPVAPPLDVALLLDRATNLAELAHSDLSDVANALDDSTPLWAHVDIVAAQDNLRHAIKKIDRAVERIHAAAVVR